jgi:hypothetical protein
MDQWRSDGGAGGAGRPGRHARGGGIFTPATTRIVITNMPVTQYPMHTCSERRMTQLFSEVNAACRPHDDDLLITLTGGRTSTTSTQCTLEALAILPHLL